MQKCIVTVILVQLNLHYSYQNKTVYRVRIYTLQSTHYIQPTYTMLLAEKGL